MRIFRRNAHDVSRLGILSSAFHPPTRAHIALADAALGLNMVEHVLFVLPDELPHKSYDNVTFAERLVLLLDAVRFGMNYSVAASTGGLFLEIARECRLHFPTATLRFLCGRDTAERIVNWDYGALPPVEQQLAEYELIVAPRQGIYIPPPALAHAIHSMPMDEKYDEVSSTEVRRRIAAGEPWAHLVPQAIEERVPRYYS